ncbi:MAG: OmpA family protein [Myxococcales bacterium]|nr:OmpA family protein [Myxococcales bacterium]MCB9647926.1 OmpA family protein [Deltaproteobacteria bacterium]
MARGRFRGLQAALGLAVLTASAAAPAQTVREARNFSAERFQLSLDRDGVLSLEWAEVPRHMAWDVSLWLGYADDPLALYKTGTPRTRVGTLVDARVGGGVAVALGLLNWVELGVELPFALYQTRADTIDGVNGTLAPLTGFGVGGPRIAPKVRVLQQARSGVGLAIIPTFVMPTASEAAYIGQDSLLFEPQLALSRTGEVLRVGANLGLRLRRKESFADLVVSDELTGRLGAGLALAPLGGPEVELQAVLDAATALDGPFADRNRTHLEGLLGAAWDVAQRFQLFGAAGLGLNQGFGTPDWRVLVGLRIFEHDLDADKDGIQDDEDACPKDPEDKDRFQDADGCPDLDNDEDGIPDATDRAPLDPEDVDGFQDEDGVPDPDNDGDGVWDWDDRCPMQAGLAVNLGCPDADRDGDDIVDRADACPDEPEDVDGFEDDDGCPDPDNDRDGIPDAADACMMQPGLPAARGCPDTDRDGDGVVDREDNCPDEPGTPEARGCRQRQLVVIRGERLEILDKVYFDTAKARIQTRSYALLRNVAAVIKAHPEIDRVEVQGHTDSQGVADANLALSQRRAEAVQAFLQKEGVAPERLVARGYGESEPIAPNETKAGRAENRRVEFRISQRAP